MSKLILVRHGQSEWNLANRFTGWWDVDLTEKGEVEAREAGELMKARGVLPTLAFTSVQKRAIKPLNIALEACDRLWIPVTRDWHLNERHYGGLTGLNKQETRERHGDEQVHIWRRSYDVPPPGGESLKDTVARTLPYYVSEILPRVLRGERVLVAAHGNSLRALVKYLDGMSDDDVVGLNIPTGIPLRYDLDSDLRPTTPGGLYLDPDAAAAGAAAVAAQGAK